MADSLGKFVLSEVINRGCSLHTSKQALEEVRARLTKLTRKNLSPLVDAFVEQSGVLIHSGAGEFRGIRAHDGHLAAAAGEADAFVLSEDLPFLFDADRAKIHARSLREAAIALITPLHEPAQELTVFGLGAGADGHIFIKFMPDLGSLGGANPKMFLFDAPEFGSLHYNKTNDYLIFSPVQGREIVMRAELAHDRQHTMVINYSVGSDMRLTMKLRRHGDDSEISVTGMAPPPIGRPAGSIVILNSRDRNADWSGTIQAFTFGPYQLSKKAWKASYSLIGVAPPTLTADLAFTAATLTQVDGDRVGIPLRRNVLELANMSIPGFYPGRRLNERSQKWFE